MSIPDKKQERNFSERKFEEYLRSRGIRFEKIPKQTSPAPDYWIFLPNGEKILAEVKEWRNLDLERQIKRENTLDEKDCKATPRSWGNEKIEESCRKADRQIRCYCQKVLEEELPGLLVCWDIFSQKLSWVTDNGPQSEFKRLARELLQEKGNAYKWLSAISILHFDKPPTVGKPLGKLVLAICRNRDANFKLPDGL